MGFWSWLRGEKPKPKVGPRDTELPPELMWLADAPMFIDERRVDAFYDAVFRPDYGETTRTLQDTVNRETTLGGEVKLGSLLPGLFAKVDATASGEYLRGREHGEEVAFQPISNAYRHLLALALHYSTEKRSRLVLAQTPGRARDGAGETLDLKWLLPDSDFIRTPPRAMILLDLVEGCKLIPAAVEMDDGTVKPLFEDLADGFSEAAGTKAPEYPGSHAALAKRNQYWQWFAENFNDRVALDAVEKAASGKKIQWIAYRASFGDDSGPFFHLSLAARGLYETGVFGYNFINRGTKHGLRIVGTLKSEPDIDVLAVFER